MPNFDHDIATCAGCGCTDVRACAGGCSWLAVNRDDGTGVCSKCPKSLTAWRQQQAEGPALDRLAALREDQAMRRPGGLLQIGPTDL